MGGGAADQLLVSQYIVKQLAAWGVKHVYGVAGDAILPILDALGKQSEVGFVQCRHEAMAAMMASAEAKLTGKPALCMATSGPGVVQLLNGLADAHTDRVPVIALTGQVETAKIGGPYKQYIDQQMLLSALSHFSAAVVNPLAIGTMLFSAFQKAVQLRGVAHLSLCKDVLGRYTNAPILPSLPEVTRIQANRLELREAAERLAQAQKPVLLLGNGARQSAEAIQQLAEQLGAGIVLSLGAKGMLEDEHPLVLGGLGKGGSKASLQALNEADLLIILGATWFPRQYIPDELAIIQVDENAESFHPHPKLVSITAHVEEAVFAWLQRLKDFSPRDQSWQVRIEHFHEQMEQQIGFYSLVTAESPIKPENLMTILAEVIPPEAIVTLDTGEHTLWFNRAFTARQQLPLFSGKWRTMGFGLPAAISAKLNYPGLQVVAIVGDGGLMMSLSELMTLAELKLDVTVVVVNNHALALEEVNMRQMGFQPFGTSLQNPDFVRLAEAFGLHAYRVETFSTLAKTLQTAIAAKKPTLIDVTCSQATQLSPKADTIVSGRE